MFNRYLIIIVFAITIIFSAILLTFTISTHASCSYSFINSDSPVEITMRLISRTIENYNPDLTSAQKNVICQSIIHEGNSNDFDPLLITAVIAAESSFVPRAISPCEAQGLMQITSDVIEIMHIEDPFNIQENIYAGTRYLKDLRQIFQDTDLMLAAYNAGPTRVALTGGIPRISETINYVQKVQNFYSDMQEQFRLAIQSAIIYPVCFQFDSATGRFLKTNFEHQPKPAGHTNPETVTAYLENRDRNRQIA